MTDLVKRLRAPPLAERNEGIKIEAADEIERLRADAKETEDQLCIAIAEKIELRDEIERLREDAALALRTATRLLESFVSQHFPPNPDWEPQSDLMGVILQLDNASTIARDYKDEIERLRAVLHEIKRCNAQYNFGSKLVRLVDTALEKLP